MGKNSGKAAWGYVAKALERSMKVLQGETALTKEVFQVGPELKSNSLNKHLWSVLLVA